MRHNLENRMRQIMLLAQYLYKHANTNEGRITKKTKQVNSNKPNTLRDMDTPRHEVDHQATQVAPMKRPDKTWTFQTKERTNSSVPVSLHNMIRDNPLSRKQATDQA